MPSFVISKLTRCRLLAFLSGPILGIAVFFIPILIVKEHLIPITNPSGLFVLQIGIEWIFATLFVTGLAAILGPYDLLVITTCVIPALFYFSFNYLGSILVYLPDEGGMYTISGGSGPPIGWRGQLYLNEHLWVLSYSLAWGLATAFSGVVLKRWLRRPKADAAQLFLSPAEIRRVHRLLVFDVSLLFLATAASLWIFQAHRTTERPDFTERFQSLTETITA